MTTPPTLLEFPVITKEQASVEPYPYVYVNADGSARELRPAEREYLETPFHPNDGARPYTKLRYDSKNGWGSIAGYLERSELPGQIAIHPAPVEDPLKPMTIEEYKEHLRSLEKGGN